MLKKIIFYYAADSNDVPLDIFFKENSNSLLVLEDKKIVLKSKDGQSEEVKVFANKVVFSDKDVCNKLADVFCSMVRSVILEASEISKEPILREWEQGGLCAIFETVLLKANSEQPSSIFEFVAEVFIGILTKHKLQNGNKRVAVVFLRKILEYFGYYFWWSKGLEKNWEKHKTSIEEFVEKLENKERFLSQKERQVVLDEVTSWIKSKSVIDLQFRR